MTDPLSRTHAMALDAADPLRPLRSEFLIPKHKHNEQIYFCGNSLGLQPRGARAHVLQVQLSLEQSPQNRRALVAQIATLLVEQLELPDDAFGLQLKHLAADPDDDQARTSLEALAGPLGRVEELVERFGVFTDVRATTGPTEI